jgi:hypothetical protein
MKYWFIYILLTLLLLIIGLPTIASTKLGKNALLFIVNKSTHYNIEINELDLTWFQEQHIQGLAIKNSDDGSSIDVEAINIEGPLWKILTKRIDLGHIEIHRLNAHLNNSSRYIDLLDLNVKADLYKKNHPLTLYAEGKTIENGLNGFFKFDLSLPSINPSEWKETFTINGAKPINFKGEIVNFPVALLSGSQKKLALDLFGDYINLKLNKASNPNELLFNIELSSPNLNGQMDGKIDEKGLQLQKTATITWTKDSNLVKEPLEIKVELNQLLFSLQNEIPSQINLNAYFPIPSNQSALGKNGHLSMEAQILSLDNIKLTATLETEEHTISPIRIDLFEKSLKSSFKLPSNPFLGGIAESTIDITMEDSIAFTAKLKSPLLNLKTDGSFYEGILAMNPVKIDYQLGNEVLTLIQSPLRLIKNSAIHFSTNPLKIALNSFNWNQLVVQGDLSMKEVALAEIFETRPIFQNTSIPWEINGSINQIRLTPSSELSLNENKNRVELSTQLIMHDWLKGDQIALKEARFEAFTNLFTLPTAIFNSYISEHNLTPLLGSMVDIQLITLIDPNAKSLGYIDMDVNTKNLHTKLRLQLDQTTISALPNQLAQKIKFTLTPEGYEVLKKFFPESINPSMEITEPVTISGSVFKILIPFDKPEEGQINFDLNTTEIKCTDKKTGASIDPFQFSFILNSSKIGNAINTETTLSSKSSENLARLECNLENLSNLTFKLSASQFPTLWIPTALTAGQSYYQSIKGLIGAHVNIEGEGHFSQNPENLGLCALTINGNRGKLSFCSQVKNGEMVLLKPLEYELTFSSDLLYQKNSILNSVVGAQEPFKFTIESKGFSLPLPFNLKKMKLGKGTLELGKIKVKNEGSLKRITSLIKPIKESEFTLWFTPIYFKINKGILALERFDLLVADQYPLAGWGEIQLDPLSIDVIAGIGPDALKYAFGVDGLEENYILRVPIHGNQDKISVDYPKATARITALVSQMQANPHLKLVGAIVELLGAGMESKTPDPTTQPFPWSTESQKSSEREVKRDLKNKKEKKEEGSQQKRLIRNLVEGASSFLR